MSEKMATEALIKPANIQEQLLGKIGEMRQNNLTAKQKEEIKFNENRLIYGFRNFSWRYFGISEKQIQELSDQEIEVLFLIVADRARKAAIYTRIILISIPIFGWLSFILDEYKSILFANSTRKLKKVFGNNFDPVRIIRAGLK